MATVLEFRKPKKAIITRYPGDTGYWHRQTIALKNRIECNGFKLIVSDGQLLIADTADSLPIAELIFFNQEFVAKPALGAIQEPQRFKLLAELLTGRAWAELLQGR